MDEKFQLDRRKLEGIYDESVESILGGMSEEDRSDVVVGLDTFLAAYLDDPRFHEAPDSERLAWLVYLVGVSGCSSGPRGFGAKSVLGHSVRGPMVNDAILLQVAAVEFGYEPVYTEPLDSDMFLNGVPDSNSASRQQIADAAEGMLEAASPLIEKALEAVGRSRP